MLADYALKNDTFVRIASIKEATININGIIRSIYNTNKLIEYASQNYAKIDLKEKIKKHENWKQIN